MEVTDPVCGKKLQSGAARRYEMVLGRMHQFCSNACHHQFQANLGHYLKKAPSAAGQFRDQRVPAGDEVL
jgi:YHS domain-containing protein